jgi:hypothetical protein
MPEVGTRLPQKLIFASKNNYLHTSRISRKPENAAHCPIMGIIVSEFSGLSGFSSDLLTNKNFSLRRPIIDYAPAGHARMPTASEWAASRS